MSAGTQNGGGSLCQRSRSYLMPSFGFLQISRPSALKTSTIFQPTVGRVFCGGAAGAAASPQNRLWSPPNCRGSDKKNEIPAKGRQPKCEAGLEVGLPRK